MRKCFDEMTKEEREQNVEKILEVLKRDNFKIIDNHSNKEDQLEAMLVLKDNQVVQYYYPCRYQSLNGLYYCPTDDRVHLSTFSVAGTLIGNQFAKYNETLLRMFDRMKIKTVYYKNGTVEEIAA